MYVCVRVSFNIQISYLNMMLLAACILRPPYSMMAALGRGTTPHCFLQSRANAVKFHGLASNMSVLPLEHIGITISVHA